ncbi:MAG: RES family NAD+ phosphorylase [Parvularculaceae bacterium]
MPPPHQAHDDRLLDALTAIKPTPFAGPVWRIVRDGRSALDGSRGAGRWNPAHLSVLYCSMEADGALSEIHFHLSLGQPVFPSRIRHTLFEMRATAKKTLKLADMAALRKFGVEADKYKEMLYPRTQEIGDAAAFLGYDGLIAPSARYPCANLVLFLENIGEGALAVVGERPVDWTAWKKARR